jgi:hypothetical protein
MIMPTSPDQELVTSRVYRTCTGAGFQDEALNSVSGSSFFIVVSKPRLVCQGPGGHVVRHRRTAVSPGTPD